jgi:hypothetical protein
MDAHAHDHIEADPLLAGDEFEDSDRGSVDFTPIESNAYANAGHTKQTRRIFTSRIQARKTSTIVTLLALLMFAVTTSAMMYIIPMFRLMEDAVCHVHYGKELSEPIEERLCKIDDVQKYFAYLGGWSSMISSVVGLVAALPYGVLADR